MDGRPQRRRRSTTIKVISKYDLKDAIVVFIYIEYTVLYKSAQNTLNY